MEAKQPAPASQTGDYDALRQRVVEAVEAGGSPHRVLTSSEFSVVRRVAEQGVLRQLQEGGVAEAGTLAMQLGQAAESDDHADLAYTISERYAEDQGRNRLGVDANAQAQQRRMALLAKAAGETAGTIVTSVLNPGEATRSAAEGRSAVIDYKNVARGNAGAQLLNGLLEQAEQGEALAA